MSCPQIWKIEKDREKEKVRLQASEAQREKELDELKKKTNKQGDIFCWRNNIKILEHARVKMSDSEQEHARHFLHKTCNHEVSGRFTL